MDTKLVVIRRKRVESVHDKQQSAVKPSKACLIRVHPVSFFVRREDFAEVELRSFVDESLPDDDDTTPVAPCGAFSQERNPFSPDKSSGLYDGVPASPGINAGPIISHMRAYITTPLK